MIADPVCDNCGAPAVHQLLGCAHRRCEDCAWAQPTECLVCHREVRAAGPVTRRHRCPGCGGVWACPDPARCTVPDDGRALEAACDSLLVRRRLGGVWAEGLPEP